MNDLSDLRPQTRRLLAGAGWHADRAVGTERWAADLAADGFPPLHPAALRFRARFGGRAVPAGGPGVTRARESVTLVPTACIGEADRFADCGTRIG